MDHGLEILGMPEDSVTFRIVACFKVYASTNGKKQEVIVANVETAAAQGEVFLRAGHKAYHIDTIAIYMEEGSSQGDLFGEVYIDPVTIHREPVPAKHKRVDIHPGIPVWKYDRDALKRPRATFEQFIGAMLIAFGLFGVPAGAVVLATVMATRYAGFGVFSTIALGMLAYGVFCWVASPLGKWAVEQGERCMRVMPYEKWIAD